MSKDSRDDKVRLSIEAPSNNPRIRTNEREFDTETRENINRKRIQIETKVNWRRRHRNWFRFCSQLKRVSWSPSHKKRAHNTSHTHTWNWLDARPQRATHAHVRSWSQPRVSIPGKFISFGWTSHFHSYCWSLCCLTLAAEIFATTNILPKSNHQTDNFLHMWGRIVFSLSVFFQIFLLVQSSSVHAHTRPFSVLLFVWLWLFWIILVQNYIHFRLLFCVPPQVSYACINIGWREKNLFNISFLGVHTTYGAHTHTSIHTCIPSSLFGSFHDDHSEDHDWATKKKNNNNETEIHIRKPVFACPQKKPKENHRTNERIWRNITTERVKQAQSAHTHTQ